MNPNLDTESVLSSISRDKHRSIERNIRVRGGIQMVEKGKIRALFFSFVFITDLAHNIDHSQSNPTLS